MKRRTFLQHSIFAAATAPLILRADTLGSANSAPANSRLGVGFIGIGKKIGTHFGGFSSDPRTQPVAVCDVKPDKLQEGVSDLKKRGYDCAATADSDELIHRDDVDIVLICTPDHWHAALAIEAMRAGKDVYVEKPMTLTIEEGKAMRAAEEKYGRVVQVGSQQRSNDAFRNAAEKVRNGYIGQVKDIYVRIGQFPEPFLKKTQPVPEGFNYDRWLGPAPAEAYFPDRVKGDYHGGWRCFWDYGARKHGDWGAHHYDIVQWALGRDESGPTQFIPKGYDGSPAHHFIYDDGVTVWRDHGQLDGYMIKFVGTDGEIMVSRGNNIGSNPPSIARMPLRPGDERLYHSDHHHRDFIDSIETRQKPICPTAVGHRTATVCHLAGIAERLGRPIQWDPAAEQIIGDPAAARMQDRPRRAGYELPA